MIEPTTGKQLPETVSLLDDLIEINKSSLPDLSSFAESQFVISRQPEEQLVEDFHIIASLLSACRSDRADQWVRQSATDPELIACIWSAFADRLAALHLKKCSTLVGTTLLRGLGELEVLPPSDARAVSASKLACLVHMLDTGEQFESFKRAVRIMLPSTPDADLICNVASSLVHLAPRWVPSGAKFLMNNARTYRTFHVLPETIGVAVGISGMDIEQWYDRGAIVIDLQRLIRARPALDQSD